MSVHRLLSTCATIARIVSVSAVACACVLSAELAHPSTPRAPARRDLLAEGARPRVLLTADRLAELRGALTTTHRHVWAVAKREADIYLTLPLPRDRSQAMNGYRNHGKTLPVLALAYRLTGDAAYREAARRWLECLIGFDTWDGSENLGRSAFATGVAVTYDWLFDQLSDAERRRIRRRLVEEGKILEASVAKQFRLLSNHCHNEVGGLALIGYALWDEAPEARGFTQVAEDKGRQLLEHAPADGAWGEGVSYWGYGFSFFIQMLEAKRVLGRGDDFSTSAWLRTTGDYFLYHSLPDAHWKEGNVVFNTADCFLNGGGHTGRILRRLASAYRNGRYQYLAEALMPVESARGEPHGAWMHFLWYDPSVEPRSTARLETFKHFADVDLVTMRSGWDADAMALAFHAGPGPGHRNMSDPRRIEMRGFGPGHAHPDINAFSLFARGDWLLVDPGYSQIKRTRDHNTVLVNGAGQAGEGGQWLDFMAFQERTPPPSIVRALSTPSLDTVVGDAGGIYVDAARLRRFRRQILFLKPDVVVVADDLATDGISRFEWMLHAPKGSLSALDEGTFVITRPHTRLWIRVLEPAHPSVTIGSCATSSDGFDPTACLSLVKQGGDAVRGLMALAVLAPAEATPSVSFSGKRLRVEKQGRRLDVEVIGSAERGLDLLLRTAGMTSTEASYDFVR